MKVSGKAKGGEDRIKRIIALLFAFALLAEQAGLRSRPVRRRVLEILYPAMAGAQDIVYQAADDLRVADPDFSALAVLSGQDIDHADDALRMAASFRVLALALSHLDVLDTIRQRQWRSAEISRRQPWRKTMRCLHGANPAALASVAVAIIDTS